MKVPRVDMSPQEKPLRDEILRGITEVIDSYHLISGSKLKEIEEKVADYLGVPKCVGVSSGTEALRTALVSLDIKEGDEVITTPFTMAANVEAILLTGATPVFADVDIETFIISPEKIREKITPKTKAILPVHLFGCPAPMKEIMKIAEENNLFVVEDCAQAFGAELNGKKCGSFGQLNGTSFYPTKNLGCYGDGGMVFVNAEKYYDKTSKLGVHGQEKKYIHKYIGWNSRLDELQSAVLLPKMNHIDSWNNDRIRAAASYEKYLKDVKEISIPIVPDGAKHVFHLYTIKCENRAGLEQFLKEKEIGTTVNFPLGLHLQEAYSSLGYKKGDFPNAELLCEKSISLPMFIGITEEQIEYVCKSIKEFYS